MHIKKLYNIGLYKPNDYDYHNIPQNKSVCCISTNFSNISHNYSKTLCIDIVNMNCRCLLQHIYYMIWIRAFSLFLLSKFHQKEYE